MDYTVTKVNGIDCIFISMEWAHSVTTRVWIKAGSDYETNVEWGISHFLEHITLKGGKKWRTKQELRDFVKSMGGEFGGATGRNFMKYYLNSPYDYLKSQIEVLGDILVDTLYLDSAIEAERSIVIQEINGEKDNNGKQAFIKGLNFFMGDCSYSRGILGTSENIMNFKKEDILNYKNALFTKDNIVVVVAGKIDNQKEVEFLIGEMFDKLPNKKTRSLPLFERKFPKEHTMFMEKGTNQVCVAIFIRGLHRSSEKSISCDILSDIIKRRLLQAIREELGLCYGASAVHISKSNQGFFCIEIGFKIDNLSFGLDKVNEVIDDIVDNGISEGELNSIINSRRGDMLINYEVPYKIADFVAGNYVVLDKIIFPEEKAKEFEGIILEDIEGVLPLLKRENRYTFYIK